MSRPVFSSDLILDAARELVVERGPRAATVEAIATAAGVPVGSIYYRFTSIDELLARLWLRAVHASQQAALAVVAGGVGEPLETAEAVALAMYDHCLANPADTLLLDAIAQAQLIERAAAELRSELESVNDEIERMMDGLAGVLFGRSDGRTRDLVVLALVDLPQGFARRELWGARPAPARRERLPAAVRAVLDHT